MAENIVQVTEGTGKKLHTWDRTIGANLIQDEFTLPGEFPYASYVALGPNVSVATANDHVLQLMAGASLPVRIRRIRLEQRSSATTAGVCVFEVWRLSTAGTGGTAVTARPYDTADAAAGAAAMTLPTAKGTESVQLMSFVQTFRQVVSATASPTDDTMFEWFQHPGQKPIIIPAGTTNGIAIKSLNATAGCTVVVHIEFVETSFV